LPLASFFAKSHQKNRLAGQYSQINNQVILLVEAGFISPNLMVIPPNHHLLCSQILD